jgi:microcystin-dependent protein
MATPYLSQIALVSFEFAPKGWALCNGQVLSIQQNAALFSLLGTTYGGNGIQTFALPDLRGRAPMHLGSAFTQGQKSGEETHTLLTTEMPIHKHQTQGVSTPASLEPAAGNLWAESSENPFAATANATMSPAALSQTGSSLPHNNLQPYLVLNFVIALQGIFPSRN